MFFLPHLFHYRPISPTLFILITWMFLEPAPFADFSQVSRTQCFNLNTDLVLWFCFACVWSWSFIIPMVTNLFQNSFLIFACSRAFLLSSSFLSAGSPKSQLSHDPAPCFGRLQYTVMHKLNSLIRLHYWTGACYVRWNSGKNLISIKTFARSNETSPAQKHRAEVVPYTTQLRVFKIQGSHNSLMHLIICLIFSIMEGETHLNFKHLELSVSEWLS